MTNYGKPKRNPLQICFSCGTKIKGKEDNALYCKKCGEIKTTIRTDINAFISRTFLRGKFKGYTFKMNIDLIKIKK